LTVFAANLTVGTGCIVDTPNFANSFVTALTACTCDLIIALGDSYCVTCARDCDHLEIAAISPTVSIDKDEVLGTGNGIKT